MFDYTLDFKPIDFRQQPELYRVRKGEQGVLLVEPYKSEMLPHWRFKTVAEAKKSSAKIYKMFLASLKADDFPGADMARQLTGRSHPYRSASTRGQPFSWERFRPQVDGRRFRCRREQQSVVSREADAAFPLFKHLLRALRGTAHTARRWRR